MSTAQLPQKLKGYWIWLSDKNLLEESHVFFRRDFLLEELPSSADLWVTARNAFHLFINGRHCAAGPMAHPDANGCFVCHFNADYLLQIGLNQISVQVFNSNSALTNQPMAAGALWLQLNIEGEPLLWTDENWRCLCAPGYIHSGIYQTLNGPNVEMVDFRKHPADWIREPFTPMRVGIQKQLTPKAINATAAAFRWQGPDSLIPLEASPTKLELAPNSEDLLELLNWQEIAGTGRFEPKQQMLWLNFRKQTETKGGGVYIAEAFINAKEEATFEANCFCNRPYRIYLNDEILKEQAVPSTPVRASASSRGDKTLSLEEYTVDTAVSIHLQPGWNRVFAVVDSASCGHGLTIIFDNCPKGTFAFHSAADDASSEAWRVAGPLKTPFALILPNLPIDDLKMSEFSLAGNHPWDMSVMQLSYDYLPGDKSGFKTAAAGSRAATTSPDVTNIRTEGRSFPLAQNNYIIYDFGYTVYGYPVIWAKGSEDDVIDVVCGECISNNRVVAYTGRRRSLSTMTLDGRNNRWIASMPMGFRYIMVEARRVSRALTIENVQANVFSYHIKSEGSFESSDEVLNRIWETGEKTLEGTIHGHFIDSPCGEQAQYIADAMVQSWASYHLFGEFSIAATALRNFGRTQLETGEIPSACPSGLFQVLPDFSLEWVLWLHRHYMYTADKSLLTELFPKAKKLLANYNTLSVAPDGPLGDLQGYLGMPPVLDLDDTIDRSGVSTGLNAIYSQALAAAAELAQYAGDEELAQVYLQRQASVIAYMRSLTWDPEKGLFADAYDNQARSETYSWQSNILAIYGGLAPEDQYENIWNKLAVDEAPYLLNVNADTDNPYFKYFVLHVAYALGKSQWALDYMKYYWGGMLAAGATSWWELFSPSCQDDYRLFSRCQGYGVVPNGYLISNLAGIRPAAPGMKRIFFTPSILPDLPKLKAVIPTVNGAIHVSWEKSEANGLEISLSASFPIEVIPELISEVAQEATFNIGEEVTILQ